MQRKRTVSFENRLACEKVASLNVRNPIADMFAQPQMLHIRKLSGSAALSKASDHQMLQTHFAVFEFFLQIKMLQTALRSLVNIALLRLNSACNVVFS